MSLEQSHLLALNQHSLLLWEKDRPVLAHCVDSGILRDISLASFSLFIRLQKWIPRAEPGGGSPDKGTEWRGCSQDHSCLGILELLGGIHPPLPERDPSSDLPPVHLEQT